MTKDRQQTDKGQIVKEGGILTAKEYLCNVQDKDKEIIAQEEYIEALRGVLESISVNMDSERVQSTSDPDKFGKIFAQIDEEERKLKRMKDDFLIYKLGVVTAIKQVQTDKHRKLLYEKYINYKSFKVIAVLMNYSYDYILELHGNALTEFLDVNPLLSS
jgi:hypothetical protein